MYMVFFLRTFESVSFGKPMNAVAELIDVEFPLQFKSGGGCSNVDNGCQRPELIIGATSR